MNDAKHPLNSAHRTVVVCMLAVLCALPANLAWAQTPDNPATSAEEHSRRGVELYNEGKFPEAIREMISAYQLVPDPSLLYNIARIYHGMEEWGLALDYYKKFVRDESADPATVQKALEYMQEVKTAKSVVKTPPIDKKEPEKEVVVKPPPPVVPVEEPDYTWAWITTGTGVALLVAGGSMGLLAIGEEGDVSDDALSYEERLDAQSSGETWALAADVTTLVGAVVVGAGAWMFATTGETESSDSSAVVVDVGVEPAGRVGAQIKLRFD